MNQKERYTDISYVNGKSMLMFQKYTLQTKSKKTKFRRQ